MPDVKYKPYLTSGFSLFSSFINIFCVLLLKGKTSVSTYRVLSDNSLEYMPDDVFRYTTVVETV